MKNRNDGAKSKDTMSMKSRSERLNAEHSANNAFVKKQQMEAASMAGKNPSLDSKYMKFDQCMTNDGEHAQAFGRSLTTGLDKKAFPVK